jgi:Concanavalin A-like lectin/glucanases superfamily
MVAKNSKSLPVIRPRGRCWLGVVAAAVLVGNALGGGQIDAVPIAGPVVWKLDRIPPGAGQPVEILGEPRLRDDGGLRCVHFDGAQDGLVVSSNPLAGLPQFTIEVLFRPEAGGQEAQRFLHLQDDGGSRALMEIRLTEGQWALDTFLFSGQGSLALFDRAKLHPAGEWHWVALRYDARRMTSFVDGRKELEGAIAFAPMKPGQTSLGVRLNRVFWFKGDIREVRFTPTALGDGALQRNY